MKAEFPTSWPMVRLDGICEILGGGTPSRSNPNYFGGEIPWVTPTDVTGLDGLFLSETKESITEEGLNNSSAKLLPEGSVLMTSRATIGATAIINEPSTTNQGFVNFICDAAVLDNRYLAYWLSSIKEYLINQAGGTTFKEIGRLAIKKLLIALPPLEEQQEIINILQQAEDLHRMRQNSLEKTEKLASALFLEMFGNPVSNPKNWNLKKLSDIVQSLDGGKSVAEASSQTTHRVLKVSAVTSGEYDPSESKYLPDDYKFPDSFFVKKGDLLISRANTEELVGATAYVWDTPDNMVLPDKIWRFVWKKDVEIIPLFIFHLTQNKSIKILIRQKATGTSGSMKNIAKPKLLSIPIPLPPLELQEAFAEHIKVIEAQKLHLQSQLHKLDDFLKMLQHQAFSGKLTENWRKLHSDLQTPNIKATHIRAPEEKVISHRESLFPIQEHRKAIHEQLSSFQKVVWDYILEKDDYIIDDLPALIAELPEDITENDQTRLKTTLATLTALGLIAKISLPDEEEKYVTVYRALREEDEFSDLKRQVH